MPASRNASERLPELLKNQTAETSLASIAVERERWWHEMRNRQAKLWRNGHWRVNDSRIHRVEPDLVRRVFQRANTTLDRQQSLHKNLSSGARRVILAFSGVL
jgi:hypothetical protein